MTLGELIKALEGYTRNHEVLLKDIQRREIIGVPGKLDSWRGVYAHLALGYGQRKDEYFDPSPTVADLLADAKSAVGKTFQGYKGGDFTMDRSTPVWISNVGEYQHLGIVGHEIEGPAVVLLVADIGEYWF